ncbi:hypothetical protein C5748_18155 [Phyllobacterium phragmitis]|uniref:Uncharacterized protein n=1 Tax=Phyllobacterium phragmitis TaxID=2670329 RepID=A0A2S9INH1_9HYPH|nr:hypothetical protein [Phyllobacterium phragmitis]PRD42079.1 hypothetical protein C5748_18155 [Phyllobacterium phragmitis]
MSEQEKHTPTNTFFLPLRIGKMDWEVVILDRDDCIVGKASGPEAHAFINSANCYGELLAVIEEAAKEADRTSGRITIETYEKMLAVIARAKGQP